MSDGKPFPGGVVGSGKGPAKKAAPAKAPAAKKTAAAKPAKEKTEGGVVRAQSTVSKEGEFKDEFDGKMYPATKFPTVRQKDGTYVRGTVTRANLPAWRAKNKAEREANKAKKAEEKKAAAAKKAADKKAADEKAAAEKAAAQESGE